MVNTRVKDPKLRQTNRKLDRQKKALMRQNKNLINDPNNPNALGSAESHRIKITELKSLKTELKKKPTAMEG